MEFFNVQPVQDALNLVYDHWQPAIKTEILDCRDTVGRVTAAEPRSPLDLPEFRRSTMDGYAVIAKDTFGASQSLPAYLTLVGAVVMGASPDIKIVTGQTVEIHTGGMLPAGADAVVMVEHTQRVSDDEIEVMHPVAPGENVIQEGEDVARDAPILPTGHRIRPQDIGGLLAVGITQVEVSKHPVVGILSCGDELVAPDENPAPGQIRDINAHTLAALVEQAGGEARVLGIARDTLEDYLAMAQAGFAEVDMLVLTAGSSVSTRDLTRQVIDSLGEPGVLQHGLAVRPGKPTILAVCDNKPVIGLPGNPVSAFLVAQQVVVPLIKYALGENLTPTGSITATLTTNVSSATGREDRVPVTLRHTDDDWLAEPVFGKSNLIYTLVNADGYIQIPLNSNGLKAGTSVEVFLFQGSD